MLGQTERRRQATHGQADSAQMPPRDEETTAPAAPRVDPIRARRRRAPEGRGQVPEDRPDDGGIVHRGDQARRAPHWGYASTSMPKAVASAPAACRVRVWQDMSG